MASARKQVPSMASSMASRAAGSCKFLRQCANYLEGCEPHLLIESGHKLELARGGRCGQAVARHGQLGQLLLLLLLRELYTQWKSLNYRTR